MKMAEAQSGQPFSLPLPRRGYGIGIVLAIFVCLITGANWQAGLTITLVLAYMVLSSMQLEWGIYAILVFAVLFIDGWAPNRAPEDVPFRLGIARIYIVEFAVYGLLAIYLVKRAFGNNVKTGRSMFVPTPLDTPLKVFAMLLPTFAIYGLANGNSLQDSFGYFEWRSLFLAIPFFYLVTTLFDTRLKIMRLATWVFGLIAIKGAYYLLIDLFQAKYPLPNIIGAGPMDEGPENVMFVFAALAAVSFLIFRFKKNWWVQFVVFVAVIVLLANLLLSTKRSAQLGFAIGFIFLFWRLPARQKLKLSGRIGAVLLAVLLVFGIFQINSSKTGIEQSASRYDEIFEFIQEPASMLTSNGTLAFHLMDLLDAGNLIIQRPLLGYGFGSHYDRQLTLLEGVGGEGAGLDPGLVHNLYLHIWWKSGILGLAIFCWLLICIFRFGANAICRVPFSESHAVALGLYSALWGDLAMEFWGPQWFSSTKVSLVIFFSLALMIRLVQVGGKDSTISQESSTAKGTYCERS